MSSAPTIDGRPTTTDLAAVDLHLVDTAEDAWAFMNWLGQPRAALAIDTETGGFEFWKQPLRLVQFGDTTAGWVVPWQDWGGLAKDAIRRYDGRIVMHNAKFDERFLRVNGAPIDRNRIDDTQAMAHLIDSSALKGLKPCGARYLDARLGAMQGELKRAFAKYKWTWATVPVNYPDYWLYSALDVVITSGLYELFQPKIQADYRDVYEMEIAATWVLSDIETKGARIDVAYCERMYEQVSRYVQDMADYIHRTYGCGTGDAAIRTKLQLLGFELTKRTPSGELSVDKEVLESIDHPLADDILARRQAQKMAGAYFRNLLVRRDGDILHPDIDPLGAQTSRMSISSPALQQMPRGPVVRNAFIAREGNKLIDVDFDQEEQRLIAHFSNDAGLIEAFRLADSGGTDFFTTVAREVFQDPTMEKSDPRRGAVKTASYAKSYGGGPTTIAAGVRRVNGVPWTVEEAEKFGNDYEARYPGYKRWLREVEREARTELEASGSPAVRTPWGRRLVGDEDTIYAMTNYKIQGTAADVLKQKLVDLDSAGLTSYIVLPVHDELLFDVPAEDAEEVGSAVVDVMRETERFRVPLTCAAAIGDTWGEVH